MTNENLSVAAAQVVESLVDDAQGADDVSAQDLMDEQDTGETVDNGGDDGQQADRAPVGRQEDKRSRQIKAAVASARKTERRQIFDSLGMSENEVRELVRNAKAEKMAKDDPEISVKAARRIVEAEEHSGSDSARVDAFKAGFQELMEDGYSADELKAFASDEDFIALIEDGKTFRQAARETSRKSDAARTAHRRKGAVPTSRVATSSDEDVESEGDYIANMSPERFRAFSEAAHKRAMRGQAVRM